MMTEDQLNRAALIAESRHIDLATAQELVYLRDLHAAQPTEDERVKEAQQNAVRLIDQLEGIEDLLSRGPWEASQPDPFPYKVTIGNYTFDCPIGSSQIRAEQSSVPSHCLIPSGIIHHDDAEGIAELRNLIPHLIKTLSSLCPVQPAQTRDEREIEIIERVASMKTPGVHWYAQQPRPLQAALSDLIYLESCLHRCKQRNQPAASTPTDLEADMKTVDSLLAKVTEARSVRWGEIDNCRQAIRRIAAAASTEGE